MRLNENIFTKVQSGKLVGLNAPNGRVTVEPFWTLKTTNASYGNSIRGPFRYYTDGSPIEYEVPSIKSISWNRSQSQDLATCKIDIYNAWHEGNADTPELSGQLGKPGFFWPKRGESEDSQATWNQSPGRGAYNKDGTWDSNFSWEDVLVEDVILRTYEGYGGRPTEGNYISIQKNLDDEDIVQTGVWIVDTVSGGSDGMLSLECRDIGRILLDQMVFPPLIPSGLYPLEYYTEGKSPFDSFWGPKVKTGVTPGSRGEVKVSAYDSSAIVLSDTSVTSSYPIANSIDANQNTYALSNAFGSPDENIVWFEYSVGQSINSIQLVPWAGGYECLVCVRVDDDWLGTESIGGGSAITYLKKVNIPHSVPNGRELPLTFQLKEVDDQSSAAAHYDVQRIRIVFRHLYYSNVGNASGQHYRAGIRSLIAYRTGANASPYDPSFATTPWTYAMDQHPTRGYWVADDSGNVYGFGDAADYDTSSASIDVIPIGGYSNNKVIDIAGTPSGKGFWVLDWRGHVWARGDAVDYGEYVISDPYVPFLTNGKTHAVGIARTYTGNGYWVAYGNGHIRAFGDATLAGSSSWNIPSTNVSVYMDQFLKNNYRDGVYKPYNAMLKCTAISGHPTKMGVIATDGSGQVWAWTPDKHRGQLDQRVYHRGYADSFRLLPLEHATSIEHTKSGNGYWIGFGSGRIAAFGDAVNQGPTDVYQGMRNLDYNVVKNPVEFDPSFFRAIIYDIARDPDGKGFWILSADGHVGSYDAEFWGQPGYEGQTGWRWHAGNFDGDWGAIVKDVLMWSGFLYYDSGITGSEDPSVFGNMESTGIKTDTNVSGDRFDKKTVIDVIKELAEVVGYLFYIDEEGRAHFESPHWWAAGNFNLSGEKIFVEEGTFTLADEEDEGAEPFIPIIHESADMLSYSATLSSADKRSEFIIGTELPDPKDPSRTGYVRYIPPTANEKIQNSSISAMRGIIRQGIWSSNLFENEEERQLMAELIGLHAWFGKRAGSVSTVGNPCISINDQVRLVERNTSETFIHLVTAVSSELDLDSGSYTMDLTTHWLGDADDWVLTTNNVTAGSPYVRISERLDSWQSYTNRGLGAGTAEPDNNKFSVTGEFEDLTATVGANPRWGIESLDYLDSGSGDDVELMSFMMYGNGVLWPFSQATPDTSISDDGTTFTNSYLQAYASGKEPVLVFGYCPPELQDASDEGPDESDLTPYVDALLDQLEEFSFNKIIVWKDMTVFDYDNSRYVTFYNAVYDAVKAYDDNINVYGPNVNLAARSDGYDTSYNGVSIDSRDIGTLNYFIANANGFDGVAVSGSFSDSDWSNVASYIKDDILDDADDDTEPIPLVISMRSATAGSPTALNSALEVGDMVFWPSTTPFITPISDSFGGWEFEGEFTTRTAVANLYVNPEIMSSPLGSATFIKVYNGASLVANKQLTAENVPVLLGNFGTVGTTNEYTFTVTGETGSIGTGILRLNFYADSINSDNHIQDQLIVLGG